MSKEIQISAQISVTTRTLLEERARQTGVKKGHLIEQALLHYLRALDELPTEYVVHPRLVVSRRVARGMLRKGKASKPTSALRKLMRDGD
jgi:hypothetical protein